MHVVIVGCGRVGSSLARDLQASGNTVSVIDRRITAFERLGPHFGGTTVTGIGFDRDRLIEAGVERAEAVAAVTNGDNSNILVARVARETFGIEAGRRPHLRPAAGGHLPAPRDLHGGDVAVDHRAGAASDPARLTGRRVGRPQREGVARGAQPRIRLGRAPPARRGGSVRARRGGQPPRLGDARLARPRRPGGRRPSTSRSARDAMDGLSAVLAGPTRVGSH